ncbi:uncharacterized protein LACBIDRAFT_332724 [Laccaria bicolor S238N-H82]|uniref:Predicted protein n=1 Tax=Laccaria bicolor (strain S238N-H82 / ATCC MYA-4686) TaxID=486041 RepID=B0DTV8_LACBS|nr:uncharacterized protein LACBIDRAFT_332724 [Laccaria bicolor S238N-H82]EDR01916.1 predicted protein [Laccaria bicolor S238N-H82]|eukprot:XP_001887307.1 predicted protein [Laccaria bicolor S238N-H82]
MSNVPIGKFASELETHGVKMRLHLCIAQSHLPLLSGCPEASAFRAPLHPQERSGSQDRSYDALAHLRLHHLPYDSAHSPYRWLEYVTEAPLGVDVPWAVTSVLHIAIVKSWVPRICNKARVDLGRLGDGWVLLPRQEQVIFCSLLHFFGIVRVQLNPAMNSTITALTNRESLTCPAFKFGRYIVHDNSGSGGMPRCTCHVPLASPSKFYNSKKRFCEDNLVQAVNKRYERTQEQTA